jgi:hypothetical protein
MKVFTTKAYAFGELSDGAKAKAIGNHHHWNVSHNWWELVYDDAATIAKLLGFSLDFYNWKTKRNDGGFSFSGFSSQGDGACFSRAEFAGPVLVKKVKEYAPKDLVLRDIAKAFQAFYLPFKKRDLRVSVKHSGYYYHERSMDYSFDVADESSLTGRAYKREFSRADEDAFESACRKFCRWLYKQLEAEYEHLTSDEAVAESLEGSEVLFCECGKTFNPCGDSEEVDQ